MYMHKSVSVFPVRLKRGQMTAPLKKKKLICGLSQLISTGHYCFAAQCKLRSRRNFNGVVNSS